MANLKVWFGVILVLVSLVSVHSSSLGIIGGKLAEPGSRPYQVALVYLYDNQVWCGGSIVTEKYILTAGHCCDGILPEEMIIIAGVHNLNATDATRQTGNISSIKIHEGYNYLTSENDICIITLTQPLTLGDKVAKAKLPTKPKELITGKVVVSGWGLISSDIEEDFPSQLRVGTLPVIDRATCIKDYENDESTSLYDSQFCAGFKGHDECYGDDGGPATCKDNEEELCGLVALGYDCGDTNNHPSIFTQVNYFLDWININTP